MVPTPLGSEGDVPGLSGFKRGPIRFSSKQEASGLLLSSSRSYGLEGRRLPDPLGQPGHIYVPSILSDLEDHQQAVDVSRRQDDFGISLLAAEGMVPRPSVPSGRLSQKASKLGKSVKTSKVKQIPPL